jgi:hypothetical protein
MLQCFKTCTSRNYDDHNRNSNHSHSNDLVG